MCNSVLYRNLIDATKNIVAQFGKDIIHEERFVNVLSDLSPGRNEPAVFKIIRSAIQDDLLKSVLSATAKNIEHQVATSSAALSKQYGYDQSLVEGILYSLAIGYGTISTTQYNALKALKNKPPKKQTPPTKNNNPNPSKPTKPTKQNPNNNNDIDGDDYFKHIGSLILATIGILASPALYAWVLCSTESWPVFASFAVAFFHLFTVIPASTVFVSYTKKEKKANPSNLLGGYCSIHFFAIIFWTLFPIFFGIEDIQYFYGFYTNEEGFPTGTIILNLLVSCFLYTRLFIPLNTFSTNNKKISRKVSNNLKYCFTIKSFRTGFFTVSLIIFYIGLLVAVSPIFSKSTWREIEDFDLTNESVNKQKEALRNERSKTARNLSFAQYNLGDNFTECLNKIPDSEEYNTENKNFLSVDGIDYYSMTDSMITVKTQWNNEKICLNLYFNSSRLFAISFDTHETYSGDLIDIYTSKYGEPEYVLETYYGNYGKSMDKRTFYDKSIYRKFRSSYLAPNSSPKNYFWTFKNSLINIDCSHYGIYATITYLDRIIEHIQKEKILDQQRRIQAAEKRKNDSILSAQEEERRIERERQRREELERERNHQRSMEQI